MFVELWLSSMLFASAECSLSRNDINRFELKREQSSIEIQLVGTQATLLSCEPWENDPRFLEVKIQMAPQGTSTLSQSTYYLVFEKTNDGYKEKFRHVIESKILELEAPRIVKSPALLKKDKAGKVSVEITDQNLTIPLN